jgi:hypothetical protein
LTAFRKERDTFTKPTHRHSPASAKINYSTASAAGQCEARRFALMIHAIRADRSQTKAQRNAIIQRLQAEQAAAVEKAKEEALQREATRVKAVRQQKPQKPPSGPCPGQPPGP